MKNYKILFVIILFISIIVVISCTEQTQIKYHVPKTKIVAVYMHEAGFYSVAVKNNNFIKIETLPYGPPIIIKTDVEKDNEWYSCNYISSFFGPIEGNCEIHISNINSINGAGWDHGKHGRGNTVRIN
jgi:hypothetical protein